MGLQPEWRGRLAEGPPELLRLLQRHEPHSPVSPRLLTPHGMMRHGLVLACTLVESVQSKHTGVVLRPSCRLHTLSDWFRHAAAGPHTAQPLCVRVASPRVAGGHIVG